MAHLTLEYSGNLSIDGHFDELCRKLAQFMTQLRIDSAPVFPPGGVRVRAIPCDDFCIADGSLSDAGFVHATLKIGAGRSPAAIRASADGSFEVIKMHFAKLYASRGLALSLELTEFSEAGTLKHNNLHARLKK